jgi:hypothetical protein
MASISKVKHAPESGVWVGLGNLEKREIWRVGRWKSELVDGGNYTGIGNGPFEVTRGLTAYDAGGGATMSGTVTRIRG